MAIKYKVLVFPTAQKDLNEIKFYFTNALKTSLNSLFEKFIKLVGLLKEHPFTYPIHQDSLLKLVGYRVAPIENYLIFYLIKNDTVQIHRVLYAKRNFMQLLGLEG
ncbi:MAG: type II toxin-antitoxin system RelE/ParE family toxin [Candidatus Saccharibacteria bacterium]|nr:type II toxin-antitoxin system RelE/ParE family toxin [Candidatus Saccharibacteria bacterium]